MFTCLLTRSSVRVTNVPNIFSFSIGCFFCTLQGSTNMSNKNRPTFLSGDFLVERKKHESLNNPSFNQVEEVRRPRRIVAALPETSPGAKTSFTRSYTVREPDHLEIYAFFSIAHCFHSIVLQVCNWHTVNKWYTVCIPCAKGGY